MQLFYKLVLDCLFQDARTFLNALNESMGDERRYARLLLPFDHFFRSSSVRVQMVLAYVVTFCFTD